MRTRAEIEPHLRAKIAEAAEQIKRIDDGTDPDLPDDMELRKWLRERHRQTINGASNVLAAYYPDTEDLV